MSHESGVRLDEFLGALKRKGIPLPFEMGTFIALEASEFIVRSPMQLLVSDVRLDDEGRVMLPAGRKVSDAEACHALVVLLGDLLVRSAPGVPPMLLHLVEHGPGNGDWSLASLCDGLEAALVPLNRSATRRVLARLVKEAQREEGRVAQRTSVPPLAGDVDAELEQVLGPGSGEPYVDAGPAAREVSSAMARERAPTGASTARAGSQHAPFAADDDARSAPHPEHDGSLAEFERVASSTRQSGLVVGAAIVALAVAALAGVYWLALALALALAR